MLVEVRPLPEKKWHGKKNNESFAMPKTVEALYDETTGKYATGLTPEEAAHYGKLLGVDLSDTFHPTVPSAVWASKAFWVPLKNQTMIFDTDKPIEAVKVKLMKASKLVANSQREYDANKYPDATHVIFDEQEEVSTKASKVELKRKAYEWLGKMSGEDKVNIIQILSNKSLKGRSDDFINVEVDDIIANRPVEFLKFVGMGRVEVAVRSAVLELLMKNILTKENQSIYYMGEMIGVEYEDAVAWFKDPNNSKMKVRILEQLNNSK